MEIWERRLDRGAGAYRASDHCLGFFALYAAHVVNSRVNWTEAGTAEPKKGAQVLAERAGVSADTVENHAIAYQLRLALIHHGYIKLAHMFWDRLYKAHWIAAAKAWRKHKDLELAINDLDNFLLNRMTPEDAEKSKVSERTLAEQLEDHQKTLERQIERLWTASDKDRKCLPSVKKLQAVYTEAYFPALQAALESARRQERIRKNTEELGYGRWFEKS